MEFEVNPGKLNGIASDVRCIGILLNGLNDELETCRNNLSGCLASSANPYITRSINNVNGRLRTAAGKAERLGDGLDTIAKIYSGTERGINEKSVTVERVSKARSYKAADNFVSKLELFNKKANYIPLVISFISGQGRTGAVISAIAGSRASQMVNNTYSYADNSAVANKDTVYSSEYKDGDVGIAIQKELSGSAISKSITGSNKFSSGSLKMNMGNATVSGELGSSLYRDGQLSPALRGKVEAKMSLLELEVAGKIGNEDLDIHGKMKGTLFDSKIYAETQAGYIDVERDDGTISHEFGISGGAGVSAYILSGTVTGGINIDGIKVDVIAKGEAGGFSAEAAGKITTGGVYGELDIGALIGGKLGINIDYSDFVGKHLESANLENMMNKAAGNVLDIMGKTDKIIKYVNN